MARSSSLRACRGRNPRTGNPVGERHRWLQGWGQGRCHYCGSWLSELLEKSATATQPAQGLPLAEVIRRCLDAAPDEAGAEPDAAAAGAAETQPGPESAARIQRRAMKHLGSLIVMGVRCARSCDPEKVLDVVGVYMEDAERATVTRFLQWLAQQGRAVDRANVGAELQDWRCETDADCLDFTQVRESLNLQSNQHPS